MQKYDHTAITEISNSLAKKFSRQFLIAVLLLGFFSSLGYFYYTYNSLRNNIYTVVETELISSYKSASIAAYNIDKTIAENIASGLESIREISYSEIQLEDGTLLAAAGQKYQVHPFLASLLFAEEKTYEKKLNFKINNHSIHVGKLIIHPDYIEPVNSVTSQIQFGLLFIIVMSAIIFIIVQKIIHKEMSLPILTLAKNISNISDDEQPIYKHQLEKPKHHETDEIGYLVNAFNNLLESLYKTESFASNIKDVLETTEAQYTAMVRNTLEIFLRLNNEGVIEFCNPAIEHVLGYSLGETIDKNLLDYVKQSDRERLIELFEDLNNDTFQDSPENRNKTFTFISKYGEERILSCTITNALHINKLKCILFVAHDITENRKTEMELRQVQKLESIGKLTGGIAHDFNNILTIIINNIELAQLKLKKDGIDPDSIDEHLELAVNASLGGADLTHRLLAFARNQPLDPDVFIPDEQLDHVVPLLSRTIGTTVSIKMLHKDNAWPVRIDKNQFENVILNLCINSRDALSKQAQGEIVISCQNVTEIPDYIECEPNIDPKAEYILIEVRDNGEGIDPTLIKKVIDPFFTTKAMGKGTGLGLSMVYGFVHQSKGVFNIESQVNKGTTVQMYFPRYKQNLTALEAKSSQPSGKKKHKIQYSGLGRTILVLEDNETLCDIAEALLEDIGFNVLKATNTEIAHKLFDENDVDLVLSDVLLQDDINGFKFADELKQKQPDITIIHMSGYTDSDDLEEGQSYKVELRKPFRKNDLAKVVKSKLDD